MQAGGLQARRRAGASAAGLRGAARRGRHHARTTNTARLSAGYLFLPILVPAIHLLRGCPVNPSSSSCRCVEVVVRGEVVGEVVALR